MALADCLRCDAKVSFIRLPKDGARCSSCGAVYEYTKRDVGDKEVNYFFEFKGFNCINKEHFKDACANSCPGPNMYCLEHLSDKAFEKAKDHIKYSEQRVEEAKSTLETMKESKRLWLVNEMSGINEQDDTLSESQDGQD